MVLDSVQIQMDMNFHQCQKNFFRVQIFVNRFFALGMETNYVSVYIRGPQTNGQLHPEVLDLPPHQNISQEHLHIPEDRHIVIRNK